MPGTRMVPGVLPPGHRCRVDDLAYASVTDWFRDHRGHVPLQAAAALDQYVKVSGSTFAEAFAALTNGGPIILIEDHPAPTSKEKRAHE